MFRFPRAAWFCGSPSRGSVDPASWSRVAAVSVAWLLASAPLLVGCGADAGTFFSTPGPSAAGAAGYGLAGASAAGGASGEAGSSSEFAGPVAAGTGGAGSSPVSSAGVGGGPPMASAGGPSASAFSVQGVCKDKLVQAPALIADFEHGVGGWGSYIGELFGPLLSTAPGAHLTAHAATFSGGAANVSGLFHRVPCQDVTAFDGISFWAKGSGGDRVRFLAVIPATDPISDGGDCDEATSVCWDHPGKPFVLSDQWQPYHVAWRDLSQYGWGTKAAFAGVVNSLLWINDGRVEQFEFSIDEVILYRGQPPS